MMNHFSRVGSRSSLLSTDFMERKQELPDQIRRQEAELAQLKAQRREPEKKIPFSEITEEERFQQLSNRSKHFIDTVKIIAYRAQTALTQILRDKIGVHHRDEARALARKTFQTEANLSTDPAAGTLSVEIHALSTPRDNVALEHLRAELTETETIYPGTDLRLIYKMVSA